MQLLCGASHSHYLYAFILHQTSEPRIVAITLKVAPQWSGELPKLAWYWKQSHSSNWSFLQPLILSAGQHIEHCGTVAEDYFWYTRKQMSLTSLPYTIVSS